MYRRRQLHRPIAKWYAALVLAWLLLPGLPAAAATYVLQNEAHLTHARAVVQAALAAAGVQASFVDAPKGNERRNVHMITRGETHIDMMPATPARLSLVRAGQLRMIPIPLDRGLLGYRLNILLESQRNKLAGVSSVADLRGFSVGQHTGWTDLSIYRAAGIPTKEVKQWYDGEFALQMEAGFLDLFPLGVAEAITYFLPHFQQRHPQLAIDPYLLVHYPWFRFVWVAPTPDADELYVALQRGFDRIVEDGTFLRVWARNCVMPPPRMLHSRRVIELDNPFYGYEIVPPRYQHLLYHLSGAS